jgi:hypothetical protein
MVEDQSSQADKEQPWPNLPDPLQHRMSMKWTTLESLRILQERLNNQGVSSTVLLLTPAGPVCGQLTDISDSYEENMGCHDAGELDVASASVHLRTNLWRMYAKQDPSLQAVDCGAIIHLENVSMRFGNRRVHLPHMALFASEILGFSLSSTALC